MYVFVGGFMDIWGKDIEEKCSVAGLTDLLGLTRSLWLDLYPMEKIKVLPKSEYKLKQQKKPYRQSEISAAIRLRVIELSYNNLSCQKIADIIYNEFNKSISRSTVSRIKNKKYKPIIIK